MIDSLPLDLFEDSDDAVEVDADEELDLAIDPEPRADVMLVNCQWCAEQFDNELPACPKCSATHIRLDPPIGEEVTSVTCQWCLTTFDAGPTECPNCNARVVVPGQNVLGEHDVPLDYNRLGVMAQRAQSQHLLAGMMLGGGLDSLAAGLIGLAITLLDDD
jgi:hypothetical protein